ncbi:hypothetical protein like AT5G08240 [Hibiscus trionum]|uniref:Uncharacterized protein n=1 Tax=Hibiscus trionum TaxID=183268 RepID=A0A9W7MHX1_HIBTR|nr:hypothetical protein like AT5G08240 [Hibiscus trionum]
MAQPYQSNPSCFLGCFGFPMKKKSQQKKHTRSLSWPRFRLSSKKSSTKTVPVNNTDKAEADRSKTKKKPDIPSKPSRQTRKQTRAPDSEGSLSEPTKKGSSLQGSPMIKPKPIKTPTRLSHAVSLPVLDGSQRVGNPRIHAPISSKELVEKFEPMIGISVIMVTLIILVLWGRVCAILCTSAWLYICPRFRARSNANESTANPNDTYLSSKEYKKKVVLEGLLHRNQPFTL